MCVCRVHGSSKSICNEHFDLRCFSFSAAGSSNYHPAAATILCDNTEFFCGFRLLVLASYDHPRVNLTVGSIGGMTFGTSKLLVRVFLDLMPLSCLVFVSIRNHSFLGLKRDNSIF
jgi:uncharacterized Zn-finger protein